MGKNGKMSRGVWLWPAISVLMLIGMIAEAQTRVERADAKPYLLRCAQVISNVSVNIPTPHGVWTGTDVKVPEPALQLLKPNKILSRQYVRDGDSSIGVALLIVQCSDAHDLEGHYPPRCYPAQGEKLLDSTPRTWHLTGVDIPGMEYHFAVADGQIGDEQVVYNFFITPNVPGALVSHKELNGAICTDINSVYQSGEDYQRKVFGAAEFQMVCDAQIPREQRDQAFVDLLNSMQDVISTLRNLGPGGN
jgi:hypothetical protein